MPPGARSRALISSRQILATTYPTPRPPASVFRATLLRLALLAALAAFCCPALSAQFGSNILGPIGVLNLDYATIYFTQSCPGPLGGLPFFIPTI
jgi:hypothetical protein